MKTELADYIFLHNDKEIDCVPAQKLWMKLANLNEFDRGLARLVWEDLKHDDIDRRLRAKFVIRTNTKGQLIIKDRDYEDEDND
jgi:hypothetical protein